MGASKYQHSPFSVITNFAYPLGGIFLALVSSQLILVSFAMVTLGAGSYWYHKSRQRLLVPFDFFGMYFVMLSIAFLNLDKAGVVNGDITLLITLTLSIFILSSHSSMYYTAGAFIVMLSSFFIASTQWLYIALILLSFGGSFFVRQLPHWGIIKPEQEGWAHGFWHILTALSLTFTAYLIL